MVNNSDIRWPGSVIAGAVVITLLAGVGCGAGSTSDMQSKATTLSKGKFVIHTLPWEVSKVMEPRTVVIVVEAGSCNGKPRIVRARPLYRGDSVYIQAEVAFPKVKWRKGVICGGVGLFIHKSVELERDVDDVRLYDTSADPPTLRWPS